MTTENSQQPDQSQPTPDPISTNNSVGARQRRPECSRCKNTGFMGWKQPDNYPLSEVTFCECDYGLLSRDYWQRRANAKHQQRLDTLFQSAGIPPHFRSFTFDSLLARAGNDPGKRPAIEAAMAFAENGYLVDPKSSRYKTGLILAGPCGMGKTGLLTPVISAFLAKGKSALWIELYDFIAEIQEGYATGDSQKRLDAARSADIILLDDLGDADRTQPESDDRRRIIFQLVNHRYNEGLPTLITTNLQGKQIAEQFGARVFERIIESCVWHTVTGRNLRME